MDNYELLKLLEKAVQSKNKKVHFLRKITQPKKITFKLAEIIASRLNKSFRVKANLFWGEKMWVVIPEIISLHLYHFGYIELGLTLMILKYLKSGMTFFDIGAHFGYYTMLASKIVGNKGQVHAFEPTKSSFEILKLNAKGKNNVVLNNLAVSSMRGKALINDYGIRFSAWNSLHVARIQKDILSHLRTTKYEVETVSVDEYVRIHNLKPDFIKIDAEDHEYEILLGMEQTIENFRPIIAIEVGDVSDEIKSKSLVEFLISKKYKPYEYKEGEILPHKIKDIYDYDNLLFLPEYY